MSCKSLINVATTTSTSVLAGATLPLATIVRRRGRDVNLSGNSVALTDCGSNFYLVNVTATFTAPVAGVISLALQQNGTAVTGATASTTITTASTEVRSLSFAAIVRTYNSAGIDSLSIVNTGLAATFSNIDMTVVKL
nr:MAG TPA: hypothetical protein [Bacteriophage sp.]